MTLLSHSPLRASSRYPAAALAASVTLALLELAPPWAAGPARAELHNVVGHLARYLASLFTPAPSLLRAGTDRARMAYELFLCGEALLMAAFICLLWARIRPAAKRVPDAALLAFQLPIAVALDSLAFHLIFAMQLAALLPLRRALAWLALQLLLGIAMDAWVLANANGYLNDTGIGTSLAILTSERCVLLLGFALAYMVRQEQQGRMRLASSNAQLRATQSLLADTVRASERMRIARDLHDAVGHHLTALNLHLELALRQSNQSGQPATALGTARELSQSLLSEVRGVVSAERQDSGIKVQQALRLLCAGIPSPAIALTMDSRVDTCPPAAAHTLLCCVQEAVTNAMRHARATLLTIDIQADSQGLLARIADNGKGCGGTQEGNGLSGMRERLAEHGGVLRTGCGSEGADAGRPGYCLEFSLPLGARA